jgi:geranylgeranyl reductase family protein
LAKAGKKVILIDSENFPRNKICGDFVSPIGIKELMDIGVGDLNDFQKTNVINCASVYIDGKQLITKDIPTIEGMVNYGRVVPRVVLDNLILEAARKQGVEIITPCKLMHYIVYKDMVTIECKQENKDKNFLVKLLIGADGSNSTVARIMNGKKPSPENRIIAVRAYIENVNCTSNQAELFFTSKSFPGYYWFFPTGPTTANVGVGMMLENFPKTDVSLKELLIDVIENDISLKEKIGNSSLFNKIEGWPLSIYNPDAVIVKDRILLTGDAAGLVNSINGEGIQYALQSGRWAAESVITCLSSDSLSSEALKIFDFKVRREIGYDMSLSNLVLQFIRNRNFNPLWMKLLKIFIAQAKKDEKYTTIAGGILAGMVPINKAISFYFIRKSIFQGVITAFHGPFGIFKFIKQSVIFVCIAILQAFKQRNEYWNWIKGIKKAASSSISLRNY